MMKNIYFGVILWAVFTACSNQTENADSAAARAQNDSSVMIAFDNKTDSELLLEGYFKIKSLPSIANRLKDGSLIEFANFSVYDSILAKEYKQRLQLTIDSLHPFMQVLGDKKPQITIRHEQDKENGIVKEIYSLFPKPWFSSFTHDSARVKNDLTLIELKLGNRGTYVKINQRNDLLPSGFDASSYIVKTLSSNSDLTLSVWCPPLGQPIDLRSDEITNLVKTMAQTSKSSRVEPFSLFADSTTIVCLSFNTQKASEGVKIDTRPVLELFFTLRDNNPLFIVSNGNGYGAYQFTGSAQLKEHLRRFIE